MIGFSDLFDMQTAPQGVFLPRALEGTAAKNEPVEIRMAAGFVQRERALEGIGAGRGVGRIPVHRRLGVRRVEARSHGHELNGARGVRVRRRRAAVHALLPALRYLGGKWNECGEREGESDGGVEERERGEGHRARRA